MGFVLKDITEEELEDILHETSAYNNRDLSTFIQTLYDMYGGIDISSYNQLVNYIKNELDIQSDAELVSIDKAQKEKIIQFIIRQ